MRAQSDASLAAFGSHYTAATAKQWGRWILPQRDNQENKFSSYQLGKVHCVSSVHLSIFFFYLNAATVHPSCLTVKMEHKLDKLAVYRTATEKDRQPVTPTPMTPEAIQNQLALHGSLCTVGGDRKAA